MKIAIIGGGMAGLGAAYEAAKRSHKVVIFEKSSELGGLAYTVNVSGEPLEAYYHHMFPNYYDFFAIARELGIEDTIFFRRAKTGVYYGGKSYDFDTPLDLLRFKPLSLTERIKAGLWILVLRQKRNWRDFEPVRAADWMRKHFGERIYMVLWKPLLASKFGKYLDEIGMTWVWGRIKERPAKFGYFRGGFKTLTDALEKHLKQKNVAIRTGTEVTSLKKEGKRFVVTIPNGEEHFDTVIVAAPPAPFLKLAGEILPQDYVAETGRLKYVGTICGILALKHSFTPFYWLNINDPGYPFLALIEHTNFVAPEAYGGKRILYLSRYIDPVDDFYKLPEEDIWREFLISMKKINSAFDESWISEKCLFRAPFTQPVIPVSYESVRPDYATPVDGLWWVSMSHIYPWDRGTDRSFHAGREVARKMLNII